MPQANLEKATEFVELNARLIDRRRFAALFGDGEPEAVVTALRAYRNPDGGFGNALEPDLRAPTSQPVPVAHAFEMLDEVGAFDDPMVRQACDWLLTITAPEGGVPFVLESAMAHPRAPWWQPDPEAASLLGTATLAGLLHKHRFEHPWLEGATQMVWRQIEGLDPTSAYTGRAVFVFLDHVPERDRAEAAMARIGPALLRSGAITTDPEAQGEVHFPLDFAPEPGRLSRTPFDDALIERHLDALAAHQLDDGGWMFNWLAWAPLVELEWRGWLTVRALRILRDNDRL
jgi:hypothetical protein